ncbi:PRC-barrel domain-containing protein [Halopiger aswanensis]|uniref:Sporulation protein YlmC with PRC-barrel domain n=1 Tax=Halopiger aswanensis TaxID=148449 RepID=A0A3R7EHH7_9EURY|nr:PRC-barrel domain-containing protein [Halopiger aswanensis]RKD97835.1 sporulation protein YlmC with PRC-barrel domain [Halopiger aswanensis]
MTTVLASTLSGKPVLSTSGEKLGTIENITMNLASGELEEVFVAPANEGRTGAARAFETTDDGTLIVPAGCMRDVDDYLLIERPDR